MYENLLKLIQQAETADRIGKIENVVGMSMEASGGRSVENMRTQLEAFRK